ncbi:helix-turn-helix domain-containing protein [Devosia neptuniae]|uniref:helix-turn-helix domain-containing protein n=1 Tax=Devosia neptuniae TaxID=191302 RepID=UPI0036F250AB
MPEVILFSSCKTVALGIFCGGSWPIRNSTKEMTLDPIYTLAEAAERFRMTKNAVARLARRTGRCSQVGRHLLFSEADLAAIWESMRVAPTKAQETVLGRAEAEMRKRAASFLGGGKRQ